MERDSDRLNDEARKLAIKCDRYRELLTKIYIMIEDSYMRFDGHKDAVLTQLINNSDYRKEFKERDSKKMFGIK